MWAKAKVLEWSFQTHEGGKDGRPVPSGGGGGPKSRRDRAWDPAGWQTSCRALETERSPRVNHRLAQAQTTLAALPTIKSSPLGAGFGSLQAGHPPASFAKFSAVPSHPKDSALRVHFRFTRGQAERSETCREAMCPHVTLSLPQ